MLTADPMSSPMQFWHPVQNLAPGGRVDLISPIGPERALLWRHRSRAIWAGDAVADFGHDWLPSRVQGLKAVSEQPSVVPGVARGAEHGARQCAGAILPEEIALAANKTRVSNS